VKLGLPVPTTKTVILFVCGLCVTLGTLFVPSAMWISISLNAAIFCLMCLDFLLCQRESIAAHIMASPTVPQGTLSQCRVELKLKEKTRIVGGTLGILAESGAESFPFLNVFSFRESSELHLIQFSFTPQFRDEFHFSMSLRTNGPLGLCAKQISISCPETIRVVHDTLALAHAALNANAAQNDGIKGALRKQTDAREFDSLREYRVGDDRRHIDWKASARKAKQMVRVYRPEQNQQVMIFVDAGRSLALTSTSKTGTTPHFDVAMKAALQLATVALERGDSVGLLAFDSSIRSVAWPARRLSQLDVLAKSFEESNFALAFDCAFKKIHRRTLAVVLTSLYDRESAKELLLKTSRLRPRHLPLLGSLESEPIDVEIDLPTNEAWNMLAGHQIESDAKLVLGQVISAPPEHFTQKLMAAYANIKNRALL
jgi:uncharacterized protein (DUF58 family)